MRRGPFDQVALDTLQGHVAELGMLRVGIGELSAGNARVVASVGQPNTALKASKKIASGREGFFSLIPRHSLPALVQVRVDDTEGDSLPVRVLGPQETCLEFVNMLAQILAGAVILTEL